VTRQPSCSARVYAPDEEAAIQKAIAEFNVASELQKRLLAQRRT
jgi:hypothetical protein